MPGLRKLKVCFLAGTLAQGGAERQLYYILETLVRGGARPRLLCLTRKEFWEDRIQELGVPIIWVGQRSSKLWRLAKITATLRKDPDVFQSQHFYTNLYAVAAARLLGIREIGALRNDAVSEVHANGRVYGTLGLRLPRLIAANSRAGIRNAMKLGMPSSRLYLLPNAVNCEHFKPSARRRGRTIRLLTAGRLVVQKRFDRFLSIVKRINEQTDKRIRATIVGEGPERSRLEQRAACLGLLPDLVEFRGAIPNMVPLYRETDIFLLTSDWEGTPNVLLEAMASGLPTVATGVGGVPDIIDHEQTGYLTDPRDEQFSVSVLLKLIDDPHLRIEMGHRAREYVEANYSLDRFTIFLEHLYEESLL
jgi:glycosyltransferase involved in cell wall biosynthesis